MPRPIGKLSSYPAPSAGCAWTPPLVWRANCEKRPFTTLRPSKEASGFIKRGHALVFSSGGADLLDSETVEAIRADERGGLLSNLSKGLPSQKRK
jgi:hypothetical protein